MDIDVNKHKDDPEITDEDITSFAKKFNVVMSKAMRSKKEFFWFPNPTPQILVDNTELQWYTHPGAEKELEEVKRRKRRTPTFFERIEVVKRWIDPVTVIILKSQLVPRELSTYHLIFPFVIGPRKTSVGII